MESLKQQKITFDSLSSKSIKIVSLSRRFTDHAEQSAVKHYCAIITIRSILLHFTSVSIKNALLFVHGSYHLSQGCNNMIQWCHFVMFTYSCTFVYMKPCTATPFIIHGCCLHKWFMLHTTILYKDSFNLTPQSSEMWCSSASLFWKNLIYPSSTVSTLLLQYF